MNSLLFFLGFVDCVADDTASRAELIPPASIYCQITHFFQIWSIEGNCRKTLNCSWRTSKMISPVVLAVHLRLNLKPDCFLFILTWTPQPFPSFTLTVPSQPGIRHPNTTLHPHRLINNSFHEAAHKQTEPWSVLRCLWEASSLEVCLWSDGLPAQQWPWRHMTWLPGCLF